jgi:hypothetical protein
MIAKDSKKQRTQSVQKDDFKSVARRLGCDPDMDKFLKKLGTLARAKKVATSSGRK